MGPRKDATLNNSSVHIVMRFMILTMVSFFICFFGYDVYAARMVVSSDTTITIVQQNEGTVKIQGGYQNSRINYYFAGIHVPKGSTLNMIKGDISNPATIYVNSYANINATGAGIGTGGACVNGQERNEGVKRIGISGRDITVKTGYSKGISTASGGRIE